MKKIVFILLVFWGPAALYAQVCGTEPPSAPAAEPAGGSVVYEYIIDSNRCVNVYFHIVRNSNGSPAFTPPDTNAIVEAMNRVYNPHNIYINRLGQGFLNNTAFVQIESEGEARLLPAGRNRADAINCYIVNSLWTYGGRHVAGVAIDIPSNAFIIRADEALTSTAPHELGHCLNLYHTFETSRGVAPIDGSRCNGTGDWVCDTPPDNRTGRRGSYNPDMTNIMSYYHQNPFYKILDHFTPGQGQRMRWALESYSILRSVTRSHAKEIAISGPSFMTNGEEATFSISNPGGEAASWTVSEQFTVLSRTNNAVRVRAKSIGSGTVYVSVGATGSDPCTSEYGGVHSISLLSPPYYDNIFMVWIPPSNNYGGYQSSGSTATRQIFFETVSPQQAALSNVDYSWSTTPDFPPGMTLFPNTNTATLIIHDIDAASYSNPTVEVAVRIIGRNNSGYVMYTKTVNLNNTTVPNY